MSETEKITKPTRRITGKLPGSLADLLAMGKESSLLRIAAIILASGAGEKLLLSFQWNDAKWWMIAAGFGTWWIVGELRQIRHKLDSGAARFEDHDERIKKLETKPAQPRRKSRGDLPVLAPEM